MKYRIVQSLEDKKYRIQESDKLFGGWKFIYREVYDKLDMARQKKKSLEAIAEARNESLKFVVVTDEK